MDMKSNYVQLATFALRRELGYSDLEPDLECLYVLLVLTRGEQTTLQNVHDAWAVWRTQTNPQHKSCIHFEDLSLEVQELDREYMQAIRGASVRLSRGQ